MNRMASHNYQDSAAAIKNALIADGLIVCVKKVLQGNGKYSYYHKLTDKEFVAEPQQEKIGTWEDGTAKSVGNAFDWRNGSSGLFSKQEIANTRNAGRPHNYNPHPITTFSRA